MEPELDPQELLAQYRAATAQEPAALEASLRASVERLVSNEPVPLPDSPGPAVAPGAGPALKVVLGLGVVAAVAVSGWLLSTAPDSQSGTMLEYRAPEPSSSIAPTPPQPANHVVDRDVDPDPRKPTPIPSDVDSEMAEQDPAEEHGHEKSNRGAKTSRAAPGKSFDEEIRLMGEARRALGRGNGQRALEALRRHLERFPKGQLRHDRDRSLVTAYCQLGRTADAKKAARRLPGEWQGCPETDKARD